MKVIFAGYPKTGTKTVNAALTELGYNCYDYIENATDLRDEWMKIFNEGGTVEDFRRMFKDVDAIMDIPGCFFWEQIHEAFPEAKIIFRQRNTEDEWWKSFHKQMQENQKPIIKVMSLLSPTFRSLDFYGRTLVRVVFGIDFERPLFGEASINELLLKKAYRTHNSYVLQNAPKDKLLVIDFEKGWQPLCEILGVPVPETPFPHKNKNASITDETLKTNPVLIRMQREVMFSAALIVGVVAFGLYKVSTRPHGFWGLLDFPATFLKYVTEKLGF